MCTLLFSQSVRSNTLVVATGEMGALDMNLQGCYNQSMVGAPELDTPVNPKFLNDPPVSANKDEVGALIRGARNPHSL